MLVLEPGWTSMLGARNQVIFMTLGLGIAYFIEKGGISLEFSSQDWNCDVQQNLNSGLFAVIEGSEFEVGGESWIFSWGLVMTRRVLGVVLLKTS